MLNFLRKKEERNVDSIVKDLEKICTDLVSYRNDQTDNIVELNIRIKELEKDKKISESEIMRADTIHTNISKLLGK